MGNPMIPLSSLRRGPIFVRKAIYPGVSASVGARGFIPTAEPGHCPDCGGSEVLHLVADRYQCTTAACNRVGIGTDLQAIPSTKKDIPMSSLQKRFDDVIESAPIGHKGDAVAKMILEDRARAVPDVPSPTLADVAYAAMEAEAHRLEPGVAPDLAIGKHLTGRPGDRRMVSLYGLYVSPAAKASHSIDELRRKANPTELAMLWPILKEL